MFLPFLFFLFYSNTFIVSSTDRYYQLPTFKFAPGGTYEFSFRNVVANSLQLAFFDAPSYDTWFSSLSNSFTCNISSYPSIPDDCDVTGRVLSGGVFHPTLIACKRGIFLTIDLQYRNPDTTLDLRLFPAIGIELADWLILLSLSLLWGFLLWRRWTNRKRIHFFIASVIGFAFLHHLFRFIELKVRSNSGENNGLTIVQGFFEIVSEVSFVYIFVVSASGLSIISEEFNERRNWEDITASLLIIIGMTNLLAWDQLSVFVQILIGLFGLLLYGRTFLLRMHEAHEKIIAIVMNSETRAAMVEARYTLVLRVLFGVGCFIAGYVLLQAIIDLDEWVSEMLIGIGEIGVISGFLYVFWMGGAKNVHIEDLVLADIDDVPIVTQMNPVRPLLGSSDSLEPLQTQS
jgi:hypothetical protein